MAPQLRGLGTLAENLVWLPAPTWHLTAVHNSSSRGFRTFFWPLLVPGMQKVYKHTCKHNIQIHDKFKVNLFKIKIWMSKIHLKHIDSDFPGSDQLTRFPQPMVNNILEENDIL